jgi:hypothetical protein
MGHKPKSAAQLRETMRPPQTEAAPALPPPGRMATHHAGAGSNTVDDEMRFGPKQETETGEQN